MKKVFILILIPLFLTGCSKSGAEQSESIDTSSPANETSSFSQQEHGFIRLNAGQSNYSNSVNLKGSVPGSMCYVEETDTLFYSDKNGLFQKNGEKTVKLLDARVMSLNIADGKLYFIIPEGEAASVEFGKVFRMDLTNEKTECIIDEDISNISVYKDRIFCQKVADLTYSDGVSSYGVQYFKCGLDGGELTQTVDFSFVFDGDMCVTRDGNSINILDMSDGTCEKIVDETYGASKLSVYNGSLYYIRRDYSTLTDVIIKVDLADKSVEEFSAEGYIEDYGFAGGRLCVHDLTDFYLEENGNLVKYVYTSNSYKSIYTCGNKIYGICGERLYEIGFVEDHEMKAVSETMIGGALNET